MKLKYELSKVALEDIKKVWEHTMEQWSVGQANKYCELMFEKIFHICQNPTLGKSIKHVKSNHRLIHFELHLIIYKNDEDSIFIDRVLHERMDSGKTFSE